MSDIIHLLPDSVANQIAAGEVIQRPASVIKELVENALDAHATHIQVVVEDAGKSLVQVIDNGCGMSETDARLSFERHATSKIKQATDLFALRTMGFRGEALASIAAVAQVELRTRQQDKDLGTCICIEGSKVVSQEPVSCPVGANFAIRNLFFNIPARRKFLKSNQTELSNIMAEFERIALAHPDVAFTLHSAGQVMVDLPAGNFRKRIVGLFGTRMDKHLVPIEVDTTLVRISGYVGTPAAVRKKNAHQFLFVNGRFMRHPYFAKAILTAYERLIPEGQQVPFFVSFEVDPARIDVNIHPTKTEIKFEDDSAIFQILLASVRESLGKYGAVPAIDFDTEEKPEIPIFDGSIGEKNSFVAPPQVHVNTQFNPFNTSNENFSAGPQSSDAQAALQSMPSNYTPKHSAAPIDWQSVYENAQKEVGEPENTESSSHLTSSTFSSSDEGTLEIESKYKDDAFQDTAQSVTNIPSNGERHIFDELPQAEQTEWKEKFVAGFLQYQGRYIVTSLKSGLALIDQHRAHMRILYERYMRQLQVHKAPSQQLLFPEMLQVSPSEAVVLEQLMSQLQEVGFVLSPLGGGSFSVMGVPIGTEGIAPTSLVQSILADAVAGQADASTTVGHIIALAMARKVAMPVGQVLDEKEMLQLLEKLFACETPNLTPNGQPTMVVIQPDKMF